MKFDFAKILEVSKRYWVIIAFCVVMLAAVIAIPTFIASQAQVLQKDLEAHKKVGDDITAIMTKQRHQPIVSLSAETTAPALTAFPNDKVIAAGEAAIKGVQAQSMQLKQDTVQINLHQPLEDSPQALDYAYRFQRDYVRQFQTEFAKTLNAATPPTDEEIKFREDEEERKLTDAQPKTPTGEILAKEVLDQNVANMKAAMPEQMRQEAATQHTMYMAPTALSMVPALQTAQGAATVAPDAEQIWFAQMGLWIQQDVAAAIVNLNRGAKQVNDAPVKELVQIYVPADRSLYVLPGGVTANQPRGNANAAAPSVVTASTDTDPFPKDYTVSPTGRICNGVFDVVHFDVVLVVQAQDVERAIQELERNRLITVNQSEVTAVNSIIMQQQGYYFGQHPVVLLTLQCEELFMRDWTHKLMPDSIKRFLNVDQQAAGQPTASAQ